MARLLRDARFAFRLFSKAPAFTSLAIVVLALGISSTTAIFSVVYGTFFAPLPYRDAEALVMVWSQFRGERVPVSARDFVAWKREATAFGDLNAWGGRSVNLATADRPENVLAGLATPGFLAMLGYGHPLALGRSFIEEEGTVGRDRVVILTYRVWQDRFGGDPAIVGRQIRLDNEPYTVVGVLGEGPADHQQNKLWLPLAFTPEQLKSDSHWLNVMGRLRPGVTIQQANANMAAVAAAVEQRPARQGETWSTSVEAFRNNFVRRSTKQGLWLLLAVETFYRQLLDRTATVPGVTSASISTGMPVRGTSFGDTFEIVGRPHDPADPPDAAVNMVTPQFFETFGIRILRGRPFTEQDRAGGVRVAIVNETFVKRYLPDVDPLTERVRMKPFAYGVPPPELEPVEWQIVGVYGDVKNAGPGGGSFPEIDVPFWQAPWPRTTMAVHTAGDALGVQQGLANVIQTLEPDLPMANVRTIEQVVSEAMAADRFHTVLFGAFAAVALILAAVGIYGVMSFVVAQRTQEIGVRMALGAPRARVLHEVLREGMTTALIGTILGAAGAWFIGLAMKGMIHGVETFDPIAFVIVAGTLLGSALVACLVPARRAASVDPIVALRQD